MSVRAILFDADGVIQNATPDFEARVEAALGFVPEPFDRFRAEVFAAERPAATGDTTVVEALAPVVAAWGAPGKAEPLVHGWWRSIDVDHAILDWIDALRAGGITCVLATNQHDDRAAYMAERLGYDARFDHSFYSCRMGCMKPQPAYFEAVVEALGVAPADALFIDDKEANVEAARGVGLQAARFVHGRRSDALDALRALVRGFGVGS